MSDEAVRLTDLPIYRGPVVGGPSRKWEWLVRAFYADDVAPAKPPGGLAIEVGGRSEEALALDVEILRNRPDIGVIVGPFEVIAKPGDL